MNNAVKEKAIKIAKKFSKTNKIQKIILNKENNLISSFNQKNKSPRKLAIDLQSKIIKKGQPWPQFNKLRP